jgi:hypothetical protein
MVGMLVTPKPGPAAVDAAAPAARATAAAVPSTGRCWMPRNAGAAAPKAAVCAAALVDGE